MNRFFTLFFIGLFFNVSAQDRMEVQRCADIDRRVPIKNIYVDEKKNKWVADAQGLFLAQSPAFAQTVDIDPAEWSLLSVKNGNQEITFPKADLQSLMGEAFAKISVAFLDKRKNELWIGTSNAGIFHFRSSPKLSLIEQLTEDNSKLRSNNIQTIHITSSGELFVGTDDGLFQQKGSKSDLIGKFFNVEDVFYYDNTIWMVGDGEVLEVEGRKDVYSFSVKPGMVEGDVVDIEFDSKGHLWIASEVVSRYDFNTEEFVVFGPAEGFTSQFVEYIAIDADDAAWVGTKDKGVYFIGKASTMAASIAQVSDLSCDPNARDAALQVRSTGGEPPYRYSWTGGLSGDNPANVGPGSYTVTVTDDKGQSVSADITIKDPRITLSIAQTKEASNGGGMDGVAEVKASGGGGFFNYKWDNGETEPIATKLTAGRHSVTITDRNNCVVSAEVEITEGLAPLSVELQETQKNNCPGDNRAILMAQVTGGQGPYTYKWNVSQGLQETVSELSAGDYAVTITDALGNKSNTSISLKDPSPIKVSVTADAPASTNNADGQASVRTQGGTGVLSFRWDNGESTDTPEKLAAGTHTVTVTDEVGCSITAQIDISEDILPLAVQLESTTPIQCSGEKTGALAARVTGGKPPFQYLWSADGVDGEEATNLPAGNYLITVTDAAGNRANAELKLEQPSGLTAKVKVEQPASTNNADGKATASAEGGSGNYIYRWDSGETNVSAVQLSGGSHTITVLDTRSCSTVVNFEVSENILPLTVELNQTAGINCPGSNSASIEAVVSGGKPPFEYQWSIDGAMGTTASGLTAGAYQLTITDAAGNATNAAIAITEPDPLSATVVPVAPASTNNADGQASVKIEGGTAPYNYQWDTGETTETASQLAAGQHELTITDQKGCSTTATITIGEDILPLTIELDLMAEINCPGSNSASIEAVVSGGKAPFEYQWSIDGAMGTTASGLTAGAYQLTVTDAAGNAANAAVAITEPDPLRATVVPVAPASTNNADGQASVKIEGGTAPYNYQWDTGETTETASQLAAGQHELTITDQKGCSTTATITIGEDILPLTLKLGLTAKINCAGDNTAAVSAQLSGGKGPFEYRWSRQGLYGDSAAKLQAGDYALTVTDAAGNVADAAISVTAPEALSASITPTAPASTNNADGQAIVRIEGGSEPYSYQWDSGEKTALAKLLGAGSHSVTVVDNAGCEATAAVEIGEDILPLAVDLTITQEILCAGEDNGALAAQVSGGKGPFNYRWSIDGTRGETANQLKPGMYSVTITDAVENSSTATIQLQGPPPLSLEMGTVNSANTDAADGEATIIANGGSGNYSYRWDNGETEATATALAAGVHVFTVTDASGCTASSEVEITEDIQPLHVDLVATSPIRCAGELDAVLSAEVSGGKRPYQYQWSTDQGSGPSVSGLAPGEYQLTVTDALGTEEAGSLLIKAPIELSISVEQSSPASAGNADGQAIVKASGGTGNYTYRWESGETGPRAEKLALGRYGVTATDSNGCEVVASVDIDENILPLRVSIEKTAEVVCAGDNTAALAVGLSGGKAPFSYQWSDAALSGPTPTGVYAGNYELTVSDASGQSKQAKIEVVDPNAIRAEIVRKRAATNDNSSDGKATISAAGGAGSYTYRWDQGETTQKVENLSVGWHSVTVTDAKDCQVVLEFETTKRIMPKLTAASLRAGQTLQVSRLYFGADSTSIKRESYEVINEIAEFLEDHPLVVIEVAGHTNGIPPHEYCDQLSTERAKAVAEFITGKGIDPARVFYKGYGKRKPKYSNKFEDGRRKNQRVEIKILRL